MTLSNKIGIHQRSIWALQHIEELETEVDECLKMSQQTNQIIMGCNYNTEIAIRKHQIGRLQRIHRNYLRELHENTFDCLWEGMKEDLRQYLVK